MLAAIAMASAGKKRFSVRRISAIMRSALSASMVMSGIVAAPSGISATQPV
jgi:hypothetical protein